MTKKKIICFISLFIVTLVAVFSFLLSDFNPTFQDEGFIHLQSELEKESPELDAIILLYEKINKATNKNDHSCRSALYNVHSYLFSSVFTKALFELKIAKDYTKSQCKRFELQHSDFAMGNIGIKNAARFYFSKELNQLTTEEQIMLLVMIKNPSLFNPFRHREILMKKVKEYQKLIKKNT
ncbi:transglycosylase domain-containing protein [Flavobacterium amniphilum]|uniref:transglycosylase domain-containing protein n=1 Tax=Flavobacterium amniphilum TaxID=1834035 RepID=UPI00202AABFC|nr:transglycosylase domain-containing protein [Flavobacterium amniphilum]MCL9806558.1 transglycosylase domain-containing protein [Flavobacterium amniphilum]